MNTTVRKDRRAHIIILAPDLIYSFVPSDADCRNLNVIAR